MKVVTAAQMREIDRQAIEERHVPSLTLMENAGRVVTDEIIGRFAPKRVAIVAGKGNNAGDGFVVARLLAERKVIVVLHLLAPAAQLSPDARTNFDRLPPSVQKIAIESGEYLGECLGAAFDCVVDAILGSGTRGPAAGVVSDCISALNGAGAPIVAIDVPSGLPIDGGPIEGPVVRASVTVTLGAPKIGAVVTPGSGYTGCLLVRNIGIPVDLLESDRFDCNLVTSREVGLSLPVRPIDGHKGTFGSVLIVAGSRGMSGAAVLAAQGAMRSGVGLVFVAFPEKLETVVATLLLDPIEIALPGIDGWRMGIESLDDILMAAGERKAVAIGPGIGTQSATRELVAALCVKVNKPLVIDADGLNCLAGQTEILAERRAPTILTPHPGELANLMRVSVPDIQNNRLAFAREAAARFRCVVALKGAGTVIAMPDGAAYINPTGNHGMAKGGSGDILTGLIGGFLAQGMTPLNATRAGVFLHGRAGDGAARRGDTRSLTAMDIVNAIGPAYSSLRSRRDCHVRPRQ